MKNFLIIPNMTREKTAELLDQACAHLDRRGCRYTVCTDGIHPAQETFDVLLFIGGDGTMLKSAHTALKLDIPIAGINAGSVGYYSRIQADEIQEKLDRLIHDDYSLEHCALLTCDGVTPVINDAVAMLKGGVAGFLVVRKNGRIIYSTVSSGIILSTTIGSTGINHSAGGAVLQNGMEVMEITPVLPYRGMKHSLVIPMEDGVEMSCETEVNLSFDGNPEENREGTLRLHQFGKKLKMISFEI